ncbi:hypothetical protein QVD17_30481 [Tagetes erecta]|uniref:Uncharacterized protein n=1 Tax=Tagetes erecta TaxID=13708 RepID=A0AAD8K812_TARER|nr:hypothetical protein QVD17_30481 [Tagetes erecta]
MNHARPPDVLAAEITDSVRCKLMNLKFKRTDPAMRVQKDWNVLAAEITDSVRCKLMNLKFKRTDPAMRVQKDWSIGGDTKCDDGG